MLTLEFDAHCCHTGTAIKHPVQDRVKAVICHFWHPGTLMLSHERESARMSKITNDCLTRSCTGCFIAVPIWQQWASKGINVRQKSIWGPGCRAHTCKLDESSVHSDYSATAWLLVKFVIICRLLTGKSDFSDRRMSNLLNGIIMQNLTAHNHELKTM